MLTSCRPHDLSVSLRAFDDDDLGTMKEWREARGQDCPTADDLPAHGIVADGVAMGFLVETDTNTALIEFYCANPHVSSDERSAGLDAVTDALTALAVTLGYSRLKCDTQLETIKRRALAHGFTPGGDYSTFYKGL